MIVFQNKNLTIFESALFRTTSTLFYNEDLLLLVDPTWLPEEINEIRKSVEAKKNGRPFFLLFTHSDYDHIIAAEAFPEAKIIASNAFVDNPDEEKILKQIIEFDHSYYVKRDYPIRYPQVDIVIHKDGQEMMVGKTKVTFYLAPGHNPDGIFTIVEPAGLWIAGDYLSNIEFPYIYHSSEAYETTVAKTELILSQHQIQMLIPGHGDIATSSKEILQRKKENLQYIDDLRKSISGEKEFDLEGLWKRYDFPEGMRPFHEANLKLLQKEMLWK